jgi:hypothetical protein
VTNEVVPNSKDFSVNIAGVYYFVAVYSGDVNNNGNPGSAEAFTVGKGTTVITVSSSATGDIDKTLGQSTIISGKLTCNGLGLGGKTMVISYYDGTNYVPIGDPVTSSTSSDPSVKGTYSINWTPTLSVPNGLRPVQAKFIEDNDYLGIDNTVGAGLPVHVVPEYIFGGLAALGACIVGFAVFKKRSSLPKLFHI